MTTTLPATAAEPRPTGSRRRLTLSTLRGSTLLLVLAALVVVFSLQSPLFFTYGNFVSILQACVVVGLLALGLTVVVLTGGIDLSFASVMALTSVTAGAINVSLGMPAVVAVIVALVVGAAFGALNGLLVAITRLQPFVVTLGTYSIALSLSLAVSGGGPIQGLSEDFTDLTAFRVAGIPTAVFVLALIVAVLWVATRKTRWGRFVYATGGNESAARLAGVRIKRIKFSAYVLCGLTAAVAGVLNTSTLQVAQPQPGFNLLLTGVAAVVVGGASLTGGIGSIGGTVVGVVLLAMLSNGLNVLTVAPFWQNLVLGVVIIGAVLLNETVRVRSAESGS
ncbi:ABC transporter permease [Microbacterium laevaniformans]|uniref:ABC transporter permease n=1 Tax=Microbacterium laevaniformans TaxID=36807 RepID=A0A4S2CWD1_9MICO|nr:ABC transporter permease [Microbacterium laevaniformans]TGY33277.1 ABC transporter permease [Microbacterium laevaniformans]